MIENPRLSGFAGEEEGASLRSRRARQTGTDVRCVLPARLWFYLGGNCRRGSLL